MRRPAPVLPLDIGFLHLEDIPLGRIYEVADELRRRARTCLELAEALERRARACRPAKSGDEPLRSARHPLGDDDGLEPIAEACEAGGRW